MSSEVDSNAAGPQKEQQGRKMVQDEDQDENLAKGLTDLTMDPSSGHHASPQTSSMEQTT